MDSLFGGKTKMRKIVLLLFVGLTISAFSQDYNYLVKCEGKLVEERHYRNDTLNSIIAYNCTDTKDSITYDGQDVVWYHYRENGFKLDNLYPFHKFYYAFFDQSLHNNHVYDLIKSHSLIEDVLWSLAVIDDGISSDSIFSSKRRTIIQNGTGCCIVYNINSRCILHQLFEIYKDEILNTLKVYIKDGFLVKLIFEGERINQIVNYTYKGRDLIKEKILYIDNQKNTTSCKKYKYYKKSIKQ